MKNNIKLKLGLIKPLLFVSILLNSASFLIAKDSIQGFFKVTKKVLLSDDNLSNDIDHIKYFEDKYYILKRNAILIDSNIYFILYKISDKAELKYLPLIANKIKIPINRIYVADFVINKDNLIIRTQQYLYIYKIQNEEIIFEKSIFFDNPFDKIYYNNKNEIICLNQFIYKDEEFNNFYNLHYYIFDYQNEKIINKIQLRITDYPEWSFFRPINIFSNYKNKFISTDFLNYKIIINEAENVDTILRKDFNNLSNYPNFKNNGNIKDLFYDIMPYRDSLRIIKSVNFINDSTILLSWHENKYGKKVETFFDIIKKNGNKWYISDSFLQNKVDQKDKITIDDNEIFNYVAFENQIVQIIEFPFDVELNKSYKASEYEEISKKNYLNVNNRIYKYLIVREYKSNEK